MTPRQLKALQEAYKAEVDFQDWQFASLRYLIYVMNCDPKAPRKRMADFRLLKDDAPSGTGSLASRIEQQLRFISEETT